MLVSRLPRVLRVLGIKLSWPWPVKYFTASATDSYTDAIGILVCAPLPLALGDNSSLSQTLGHCSGNSLCQRRNAFREVTLVLVIIPASVRPWITAVEIDFIKEGMPAAEDMEERLEMSQELGDWTVQDWHSSWLGWEMQVLLNFTAAV